jgi:hypothetical protein
MAIVVAEGIVEVTADASKIPGKVAKDIDSNSGPVEKAGGGLGGKLLGGLVAVSAAVGVGEWLGGAVSGASDLNETLSKSQAIFGDQMSAMDAWASNAAATVGLSRSAALEAAAGFGDMFTQIGFTGDAAAQMSRDVVQASADLGSFSNLDTADVTDRISAAMRGEYDSLQAVIPNINAARVESEALAATGKKTAKELTAQEKATAVLAIVQKDGSRAMGDFAKTSDSAANATKIANAELENQQAKIGGTLLPIWGKFLSFINTTVIPGFSAVVGWIIENKEMLGGIAIAVGAAAAAWGIMTGAMAAYNAVMGIMRAVTAAGTVAQWALNVAMSANPIGIVITLIALLVGAIIWVATQTTFFQDAWANVTSFIGTAWQWLWDTVLNPVFTAIGEVFSWLYNNIILPIVTGIMIYIGLWAAIFTWLWTTVIQPIFNFIGGIFSWLYNTIVVPVVGFIVAYIRTLGAIFSWLWANAISPAFKAVQTGFNWVWNNVIKPVADFISGAMRNIGKTVEDVFGGIGDFIGSAFNSALSMVRTPLNGIIGLVNNAISALNGLSVTIPDWVPIVGGQTWGLNLPSIPKLARGSANAPGMFLAGEAGPELIRMPAGGRVYPNDQTRRMLGGGGGDRTMNVTINEASDPLGTTGRLERAWRNGRVA